MTMERLVQELFWISVLAYGIRCRVSTLDIAFVRLSGLIHLSSDSLLTLSKVFHFLRLQYSNSK